MRALLLFPLVALAVGVPFELSEHQKIKKIWGVDSELRLAIAEQILHEEGQRIGISGKDYLDSCYG